MFRFSMRKTKGTPRLDELQKPKSKGVAQICAEGEDGVESMFAIGVVTRDLIY